MTTFQMPPDPYIPCSVRRWMDLIILKKIINTFRDEEEGTTYGVDKDGNCYYPQYDNPPWLKAWE